MKSKKHMTRWAFAASILGLIAGLGAASLASADPPEEADAADPSRATLAEIERTFGFVPAYLRELPGNALPGTWEQAKALEMNPATALGGKVKELIGLGVAAQIPCTYCVEAHTEFARLNGASDKEIAEAVAMAANTRHWSAVLNGIQPEEAEFRAEIGKMVEHMKKGSAGAPASRQPAGSGDEVTRDIVRTFGLVPVYLRRYPEASRAAAWRTLKDVELAPGALPAKHRSLISVAVASQIPCRYCVIADGEFAKLEGATEAEIGEAVAMAAFTRQMSTYFHGMRIDPVRFRGDLARMSKVLQAAARPGPAAAKQGAKAAR